MPLDTLKTAYINMIQDKSGKDNKEAGFKK